MANQEFKRHGACCFCVCVLCIFALNEHKSVISHTSRSIFRNEYVNVMTFHKFSLKSAFVDAKIFYLADGMLKLTERMKEMMNVQWGSLDSMETVHVYAIVHLFLCVEKLLIWEHLCSYFVNLGKQVQCFPIRFTWGSTGGWFCYIKNRLCHVP